MRYSSTTDVMEELGVSRMTVHRLIERGELSAIRVSERIVRIPRHSIDAYKRRLELASQRRASA